MSKLDAAVCGLMFFVLCGCVQAQDAKPSVDGLAWMAGCWERSVPERQTTTGEQWMKPAGGTMIGMSRTVKAGKTTGFEFLRIVTTDAGFDYVAKPSANPGETAFKMVKASAGEVIFENLEHDFPQRIIYRSDKPDELFARIEGTRNGKLSGMDIPMKRVKCE